MKAYHRGWSCLVSLVMVVSCSVQAAPLERLRHILLPEEQFYRLGEKYPSGLFLDERDLNTLERRVEEARSAEEVPEAANRFPLFMAAASYEGVLLPGVLRLRALLDLQSDSEGWQSLDLPLMGSILAADVIVGDAALARVGNHVRVFAQGPGPRRLELWLDLPLQEVNRGQEATLLLASPGRLILKLPGSIRPLVSGVPLEPIQRDPDGYVIPLAPRPFRVRLEPRSILVRQPQVEQRGRHLMRIEASKIVGSHQIELRSWSEPVRSWTLPLPEGCTVQDVRGPDLQDWSVRDGALFVTLARGKELVELEIQTFSPIDRLYEGSLSIPLVRDVRWRTDIVNVSWAPELSVRFRRSGGSLRLPVLGEAGGSGRFLLPSPDSFVGAEIRKRESRQSAVLRSLYRVTEEKVVMTSTLLLETDGRLPRVAEIQLDKRDALLELSVAELPGAVWDSSSVAEDRLQRVSIDLPRGRTARLEFRTERLLSESILAHGSLDLEVSPPVLLGGADLKSEVGLAADKGLQISLLRRQGHFPIDVGSFGQAAGSPVVYAFRSAGDADAIQFSVSKVVPRLEAETTTFVHLTDVRLEIVSQVRFHIREAATDRVQVVLPSGTGRKIRIEAPGIQERVLESGVDGDIWTLRLREKVMGEISVIVAFDRAMPDLRRQVVKVPEVGAAGVASEKGTLLFEVADHMALRIIGIEGRKLELEELRTEKFYQPTDRVLAAYRTLARAYECQLEIVRYEPEAVISALARRATIKVSILPDGLVRSEAAYQLNNAGQQFLSLRRGSEMRLFSTLIDDEPVKPFKMKDRVLIALRTGKQEVRLSFEERLGEARWFDGVRLVAPDIGVPVLETVWEVHPPAGFEAYSPEGAKVGIFAEPRFVGVAVRQIIKLGMGLLMPPFYEQPDRWEVEQFVEKNGLREKEDLLDEDDLRAPQAKSVRDDDKRPRPKRKLVKGKKKDSFLGRVGGKGGGPALDSVRPPDTGRRSGVGMLSLDIGFVSDTPAIHATLQDGRRPLHLRMIRTDVLDRIRLYLVLTIALASGLLVGLARLRHWFAQFSCLLFLYFLPDLLGAWIVPLANAASGGVLLGMVLGLASVLWRNLASGPGTAALLALFLVAAGAHAKESGEVTTVYHPYELRQGKILEGDRAFLSRADFDRWFDDGEISPVVFPKPPLNFTVVAVDCSGEIDGNRAHLEWRLELDFLTDGWVEVPIGISGLILETLLDGEPVALRSEPEMVLVAKGRGRHELIVKTEVADEESGPRGTFRLHVPRAVAGRLRLKIPDDIEVKTIPATLAQVVPIDGGRELRIVAQGTDLLVKTAPRLTELGGGIRVENWLLVTPLPSYFQIEGRVSLEDSSGLPGSLEIEVPAVLSVRSIRARGLLGWFQEGGSLRLRLEPGTKRLELNLDGAMDVADRLDLTPLSLPGGVPVHGGLLVLGGAAMEIGLVGNRGLERVEPESLLRRWPAEVSSAALRKHLSNGQIKWAFRADGAEWDLSLVSRGGRERANCRPTISLRVEEMGVHARIVQECQVTDWPVYDLALSMPDGWRLRKVEADRPHLWTSHSTGSGTLLETEFPQGLLGKVTVSSLWSFSAGFELTRGVVETPAFELPDAEILPGFLGLSSPPSLEIVPSQSMALTALDSGFPNGAASPWPIQQAFAFRTLPRGEVRVKLRESRASSSVAEFIKIGEAQLEGSALLLLDAGPPGIERVLFLAPRRIAGSIEITGEGVRHIGRKVVENGVEFEIEFQRPVATLLPLEVHWQTKLDLQEPVLIPRLQVLSPAATSSYLFVDTVPVVLATIIESSDLEMGPDLDKLPALPAGVSLDQVRWIVRYRGPKGSLTLRVERPETEEILEAIIDSVELTSVVAPSGLCRTRAVFELQNQTEQFLEVTLPQGAELWSALVAGQPVKPAKPLEKSSPKHLIPLIQQSAGDLSMSVEIVYVLNLPLEELLGNFDLVAPKVENIPVEKTLWTLHLPRGLRAEFEGGFQRASQGVLTTEKLLDVVDQQQKLLRMLQSGEAVAQGKLSQNLQDLEKRYNRLNSLAISQLGSYRRQDTMPAAVKRESDASQRLQMGQSAFATNEAQLRMLVAQSAPAPPALSSGRTGKAGKSRAPARKWVLKTKKRKDRPTIVYYDTGAIDEVTVQTTSNLVANAPADKNLGDAREQQQVQQAYSNLNRFFGDKEVAQTVGSDEVIMQYKPGVLEPMDRLDARVDGNAMGYAQSEEEGLAENVVGTESPLLRLEGSMNRQVLASSLGESKEQKGRRASLKATAPGPMSPDAMPREVSDPKQELAASAGERRPGGAEGARSGTKEWEDKPMVSVARLSRSRQQGFVSLEIPFPVQGRAYFFKKLKGGGLLQVRYTSEIVWQRVRAAGFLAVGLLLLWGFWWLSERLLRSMGWVANWFVTAAAPLSVAFLILFALTWVPLFFLAAILELFVLVVRSRRR